MEVWTVVVECKAREGTECKKEWWSEKLERLTSPHPPQKYCHVRGCFNAALELCKL